jgi:lysozyme
MRLSRSDQGPRTIWRLPAAGLSAILLTLVLSACGMVPIGPPSSQVDRDPHEGVARAHRMPVLGIDVSRWQGDIDWREVARSGIDFAFIKATEGGDHVDPAFSRNWREAAAAGVPRAAYHFMYWCRPVHQQALWFILNVPPDPNALPPVLDVEWNSSSSTCPRRIPAEEAREMIATMLAALEAHTGKRPIIYTDIAFHREVLGGGEFDEYPFWLRSVAAEPREVYPGRDWSFWQYTTTGQVRGIDGDVDRNAFGGSEAEWLGWLQAIGIALPGA